MKKIHWVGDSTVAYNNIKTYPQTGIGQVFHLYCKREYEVIDYAKNGASSKSFYDSGLFDPVIQAMEPGDFLFIQFGHNDQKPQEDRHTDPYTTYQEYLMKYVSAAREKGAHPVFITSLSRRHFTEDGKIKDTHTEYPGAMIDLAQKENIPYIDLCQSSKQFLEETGELDSRKWFMYFPAGSYSNYSEDKTDNTHLHYEGAVVMAGLVAEGLRSLKGLYEEILLP
ncbi:MAG: rhamnogalacturonan acetylesterase [Clostridiales bacterium]|nr:rhamnogalacturonan acetylesterase [Clostridiales bacterium]